MRIKKEFAPITIQISSVQELNNLKALAQKAIESSEYFCQIFRRGDKNNPEWMNLAREILEL